MQTPFREQTRLAQRWQAQRTGEQTVRVFVPAGWAKQRVFLTADRPAASTGASINGRNVTAPVTDQGQDITDLLTYGSWNEVANVEEPVDNMRLIAASSFRIASLAARNDGRRCLSLTLELSDHQAETGKRELCSIYATLTSEDGRQVGALELTVLRKSCSMTVALEVSEPLSGAYRLKVVLCGGDRVLDNARLDLSL